MLLEFEREHRRKTTVVLRNCVPEVEENKPEVRDEFEKAVVFCASFLKRLVDIGHEVQLVTDSGRVPYGTGHRHLQRILRALAMIQLVITPGRSIPDPSISNVFHVRFRGEFQNGDDHSNNADIDVRSLLLSKGSFTRKGPE
jgi:uncharacterized protein (DUF58 family)